jgi:hypothetical protein
LLISGVLFYQIKRIRESFIKKIRFPELEKDLKTHTSKLSDNIKNWGQDKQNVLELLSSINAILKNIKSRNNNKEIKSIINITLRDLEGKRNIKEWSFRKKLINLNENELWDLYNKITETQATLSETIKDMKWENNE